MCFIWIRVDVNIVFCEFGDEDVVVGSVAEAVEGFIGVFDSEFDDRRVIKACSVDNCVEMGAVAGALVRGKDQELRNPESRG